MEKLIPVINKLQDVFNTIQEKESIELPQIVVVGTQSAGKSSVLENLVGRDFLPRGHGIVTRRPLVLQLINLPVNPARDDDNDQEWAEFLNNQKVFRDFDEICLEIVAQTERISPNKGISDEPINLKIYSTKVLNLTLVDLPGITKVPVGDQPDDIELRVKSLIRKYITNPNSLILAITPANIDFETSEALQMAREVDPEGKRTLAVLTKLDLMDRGTDAVDVLMGRKIPVKLGIVGVLNRSQEDIDNKKSIASALKKEEFYLSEHYPRLAKRNGTPYLAEKLNNLLMNHIRKCLPDLKNRVNTMTTEYRSKREALGNSVKTDSERVKFLLDMITTFAKEYCNAIEGQTKIVDTEKLCGGARISHIFYEDFCASLEQIDPLSELSLKELLTSIRNSMGLRPRVFAAEESFRSLVVKQIDRLLEPSLGCVEKVYRDLTNLIENCGTEIEIKLSRFPKLYEKIVIATNKMIQEAYPHTRQKVKDLISIQTGFINTLHPDFKPLLALNQDEKGDNDGEDKAPRFLSFKSDPKKDFGGLPGAFDKGLKLKSKSGSAVEGEDDEDLEMTLKEKEDCALIQSLISRYFDIIRKTTQDSVPKSIVHFMIEEIKSNLQQELIEAIYTQDPAKLKSLLNENPETTRKREETEEMLEALEKSREIICHVREADFLSKE